MTITLKACDPQPPDAASEKTALHGFTHIRKRGGSTAEFDSSKITTALTKAGLATGEFKDKTAHLLTFRVLSLLSKTYTPQDVPSVEGVQDVVEDVLLSSSFKKTAKAFILYRDQHARNRELAEELAASQNLDLVDQYLSKLDWEVKENSNMTYSLQGLNNYLSNSLSKNYWLNKIYTPEVREASQGGDIHIHDMGLLSVYCVGWDLQDLLTQGFTGVEGKVQSAPPKHLASALGQTVNFFYSLQGEAAGAQAFANFDTLMAPFIRYDNLSYAEVKQHLQEFVYNVNVPTRVGFQTPFTNVTMDLQPPKTIAHENVIIGGERKSETYADFQEEMDMFNQAFLEVMEEGDANGRVFTFPIPTYNITPDFDWENPNLAKLWEVTAKYGIPYFANFVNSDMSVDDARSMCCRLRLDNRELNRRGGGLFGANPLTGSIGVVTVNLPRIGYLAATGETKTQREEDFFARLSHQMDIAMTSLETKRKVLESLTEKGLYPYSKFYLRSVKDRFGVYWQNHFSTIGLVGMNEAIANFMGESIGTQDGQAFANKVLDFMRDKMVDYQETTGNMYNLEATPAEGTAYRLARMDRKKFANENRQIIVANTLAVARKGAEPFYTNSSQLPVNYTDDAFEMLDLQDDLQSKYTGGTVQHIFLGESASDPQAVKHFVRAVCSSYRLPYISITPTFSVCPNHGYLSGAHPRCPHCQEKAEVYSRVVGYLRPVSQWNDGKQAEYTMRETFDTSVDVLSMSTTPRDQEATQDEVAA